MPIYEYQCDNCGHQCEKLQKVSAEKTMKCTKCENGTMSRLVSKTHFKLQGTGWYETDFKEKKSKTLPSNENSSTTKNSPKENNTEKKQAPKKKPE